MEELGLSPDQLLVAIQVVAGAVTTGIVALYVKLKTGETEAEVAKFKRTVAWIVSGGCAFGVSYGIGPKLSYGELWNLATSIFAVASVWHGVSKSPMAKKIVKATTNKLQPRW